MKKLKRAQKKTSQEEKGEKNAWKPKLSEKQNTNNKNVKTVIFSRKKSMRNCRISIETNHTLTIFLAFVQLTDESDDDAESGIGSVSVGENSSDPTYAPTGSVQRGSITVINEELVSALDRCAISDRKAVYILYTAAEAFGLRPDDMIISRTAIQNCRKKTREAIAMKIKDDFIVS